MSGTRIDSVAAPDGGWIYSLYSTGAGAFIHALPVSLGSLRCTARWRPNRRISSRTSSRSGRSFAQGCRCWVPGRTTGSHLAPWPSNVRNRRPGSWIDSVEAVRDPRRRGRLAVLPAPGPARSDESRPAVSQGRPSAPERALEVPHRREQVREQAAPAGKSQRALHP